MVRKCYLSDEKYNQMVNESFSDSDESDDSFPLELESDFSDETSDSDTDICQRVRSLCVSLQATF